MKDLRAYLVESRVEHLYELFRSLGIDESQLLAKLKYSDLEKIGVENLIERRKVFDIINEINQDIYREDIEMNENVPGDVCKADGALGRGHCPTDGIWGGRKPVDGASPGAAVGKSNLFEGGESITQKLSSCSMPKEIPRRRWEELDDLCSNGSESMLSVCDVSVAVPDGAGDRDAREEKIIVCVRKRPCGERKLDIVDVDGKALTVNEERVRVDLSPYVEQHRFRFDHSFDWEKENADVYRESVKGVVNHVISGGFGTVLAYGQTGTGKTYTMLEKGIGMIYLAIRDITAFRRSGTVTFCEIYMGQVYDLLDGGKKIQLREVNGVVHLSNSREEAFRGHEEALRIVDKGMCLRKTGVTGANSKSSRSHAVILVNLSKEGVEGHVSEAAEQKHFGSIVFVDLAGSERGSDRKEMGAEVKNEGAEINKSLLALKECIRGMEKDRRHLPFRQSKLTQILKNSFVGTSRTCLIATISPTLENVEHTLNTLRYASRIKESSTPKDKRGLELLEGRGPAGKPAPSPTVTSRRDLRNALACDIKKALMRIESRVQSLRTPEELQKMLSLLKEMEGKLEKGRPHV